MTEKRLYDVIDKAEPRGQSVTYEGIPCTARTCATRLNRLTWENEQLKHQNDNLVDMIARVQYRADLIKEENEQLRQPNCRNCIHFSCDNADIYCMKKEYESIPDCSIAKDCDEYEGLYE